MRPALYCSGPITDTPNFRQAFDEASEELRALGWRVYNPAAFEDLLGDDREYSECLRLDLFVVMMVQALWMLPGWSRSRGARVEHDVAKVLNLDVYYAGQDEMPAAPVMVGMVPA